MPYLSTTAEPDEQITITIVKHVMAIQKSVFWIDYTKQAMSFK